MRVRHVKRAFALWTCAVAAAAGLVTVAPVTANATTGTICNSTANRSLCGKIFTGSNASLDYKFTGLFGPACVTSLEMDWFNSSGQLVGSESHPYSCVGGTVRLVDNGFGDWSWLYPGGHAQGVAWSGGSSLIHTPFIYY